MFKLKLLLFDICITCDPILCSKHILNFNFYFIEIVHPEIQFNRFTPVCE